MATTGHTFQLEANIFKLEHLLDIGLIKYVTTPPKVLILSVILKICIVDICLFFVFFFFASYLNDCGFPGTRKRSRRYAGAQVANSNWKSNCAWRKKNGPNRCVRHVVHMCTSLCSYTEREVIAGAQLRVSTRTIWKHLHTTQSKPRRQKVMIDEINACIRGLIINHIVLIHVRTTALPFVSNTTKSVSQLVSSKLFGHLSPHCFESFGNRR